MQVFKIVFLILFLLMIGCDNMFDEHYSNLNYSTSEEDNSDEFSSANIVESNNEVEVTIDTLDNNSNDNEITAANTNNSKEPTFLELEYVCLIENANFSIFEEFAEGEFTWWNPYYDNHEETAELILEDYLVELPYIDTEGKLITISMGRKLKQLYYYEESRYDTFNGQVFGRPVFEKEYYPNTIFVYLAYPCPALGFISNYLFTDDMYKFNREGNVYYEVMPYEQMDTGLVIHEERPYQKKE